MIVYTVTTEDTERKGVTVTRTFTTVYDVLEWAAAVEDGQLDPMTEEGE
jgi:hypothetical protein